MAKTPKATRDAIAAEAKRRSLADDGKSSMAERFAIRNAIRAEMGLGAEKRKRGGLAGAWDRSKDVIVPIAAAGLGALTGGLAAPVLAGSLARGFDREGQSGIGFDVGQGAMGALEGYGAGSVGKFAAGALKPVAATSLAPAAPMSPAAAEMAAMESARGGAMGVGAGNLATSAAPAALAPAPASAFSLGGIAGKAGGFLKDNWRNVLGAAQGINAANQQRKANEQVNRAVALDTGRWQAGEPLRTAGMEQLLAPRPAADLTNLRALAARGNPFATRTTP